VLTENMRRRPAEGRVGADEDRASFVSDRSEARFFDEFSLTTTEIDGTRFRLRMGGSGPPLMLLHGHPRTHTTWWQVAPILARSHTVICPDLPGFGQSSVPPDAPDLPGSSKRAKAKACVSLMRALGFERFGLVGHDRGGYTAFRAAMDWPEAIDRVALLDVVPILEALERCDWQFARSWWHWFFFAVEEKPESAILADPVAWYGTWPKPDGIRNRLDAEAAISRETTIRSMVADYRAGVTIDWKHDAADREAGRKLRQPVLCLWSLGENEFHAHFGDLIQIWRSWAENVRGRSLPTDHHMAEEAPAALATELGNFFD
jgi:haloacetate dehalogenase